MRNGRIARRTLKRDGRVVYDVIVETGYSEVGKRTRHDKRGFPTLKASKVALAELTVSLDRCTYVRRDQKLLTGDYLATWAEGLADVRESTRAAYRHHVTDYLIPGLGHIPLVRVQSADVKRFVSDLPSKGKRRELKRSVAEEAAGVLTRAVGGES